MYCSASIPSLFLALAASTTAAALPAKVEPNFISKEALKCPDKSFDDPWIISDIEYNQPSSSSGAADTISFHFCDLNKGLRFDTNCNATVTNGTVQGDDGGYVECQNATVAFQFEGGNLLLFTREYEDDW